MVHICLYVYIIYIVQIYKCMMEMILWYSVSGFKSGVLKPTSNSNHSQFSDTAKYQIGVALMAHAVYTEIGIVTETSV